MLKRAQQGNILFLILIAVALFAALSYAVTGSSRTSADSISKDKSKILAAEIIQYAAQIEQGISRMRIINNVPEYGFDVSSSGYTSANPNTTCTKDNCKLFHPDGGGVVAKILPDAAWDKSYPNMINDWQGKMWFKSMRVKDLGSDAPDFLMTYPGLNAEVCAAINKELSISELLPEDSAAPAAGENINYTGTLTSYPIPTASGPKMGDEAPILAGKRSFCAKNNASYYYWHVLIER